MTSPKQYTCHKTFFETLTTQKTIFSLILKYLKEKIKVIKSLSLKVEKYIALYHIFEEIKYYLEKKRD